jgi:hypothetical protein
MPGRPELTWDCCRASIAPAKDNSADASTKRDGTAHRYLLVEASCSILRRRSPHSAGLYEWATAIRERRGTKISVVALARKLAGILYAMWRDATDFKSALTRPGEA